MGFAQMLVSCAGYVIIYSAKTRKMQYRKNIFPHERTEKLTQRSDL
ncbi:Uncharacterised protein [Yersinia frederiksenii]|uniref:Uncharacterized protein n=2 Tax=Yersinia frederiksenii TaxID=29484 RepID=A0A380PY88_YERFR|nr:hypothetical protein DJ58_828 [Yersinia frederiksenii ATCC 33641]CFR11376.1 Uncharacterised protein [Yersinia frederiksenii]CNC96337.1 Uncharacterised protein [Yersinia frederiksenii]CNF99605.1 Uncharacterised protein [Yersinia frederiksenii]SUP77947.1 Uncharacterised protein [Yersinia frederiksenii]